MQDALGVYLGELSLMLLLLAPALVPPVLAAGTVVLEKQTGRRGRGDAERLAVRARDDPDALAVAPRGGSAA